VLLSIYIVKPYATLTLADDQTILFYALSIKKYLGSEITEIMMYSWPLFTLALIVCLLSLFTIFLFNRRILQIRMCFISALLLVVHIVVMYLYYNTLKSISGVILHSFKLPAIFPVIGIILNFMAYRAIHHDEMLVKSYDRLR
jgi:drug/metabolite transporter (DMT)-like permease